MSDGLLCVMLHIISVTLLTSDATATTNSQQTTST